MRPSPIAPSAADADPVDDRHAGVDQHLRPEVRVAAGDHRRGVDDGRDLGVDQGLRGGAVQVDVVEHGDVAGAQPRQQDTGAPLDACGAG